MDISKDYYATLGVLPSAEDYIVQAAYKALCKRFHPDIYKGTDAHERMAAINEAYEVLGDSSKRAEYDRRRGETTSDDSDFFNDDFDQSKRDVDPFEEDWKIAVGYYPELVELFNRLGKISSRLAFSFRAYILQEKEYEKARDVADLMERNFLNQFFGTSAVSHTFARELIEAGRKDVLRELNKTIKVLGSGSGKRVVNKLREKHQIFGLSTRLRRITVSGVTIEVDPINGGVSLDASELSELQKKFSPDQMRKAVIEVMKEYMLAGGNIDEDSPYYDLVVQNSPNKN